MVRTLVTPDVIGVAVGLGLKPQVTPVGGLVQDRVTPEAPCDPVTSVAVMVVEPELVGRAVMALGLEKVKSQTLSVTVVVPPNVTVIG